VAPPANGALRRKPHVVIALGEFVRDAEEAVGQRVLPPALVPAADALVLQHARDRAVGLAADAQEDGLREGLREPLGDP
jgi:hypothetical protein